MDAPGSEREVQKALKKLREHADPLVRHSARSLPRSMTDLRYMNLSPSKVVREVYGERGLELYNRGVRANTHSTSRQAPGRTSFHNSSVMGQSSQKMLKLYDKSVTRGTMRRAETVDTRDRKLFYSKAHGNVLRRIQSELASSQLKVLESGGTNAYANRVVREAQLSGLERNRRLGRRVIAPLTGSVGQAINRARTQGFVDPAMMLGVGSKDYFRSGRGTGSDTYDLRSLLNSTNANASSQASQAKRRQSAGSKAFFKALQAKRDANKASLERGADLERYISDVNRELIGFDSNLSKWVAAPGTRTSGNWQIVKRDLTKLNKMYRDQAAKRIISKQRANLGIYIDPVDGFETSLRVADSTGKRLTITRMGDSRELSEKAVRDAMRKMEADTGLKLYPETESTYLDEDAHIRAKQGADKKPGSKIIFKTRATKSPNTAARRRNTLEMMRKNKRAMVASMGAEVAESAVLHAKLRSKEASGRGDLASRLASGDSINLLDTQSKIQYSQKEIRESASSRSSAAKSRTGSAPISTMIRAMVTTVTEMDGLNYDNLATKRGFDDDSLLKDKDIMGTITNTDVQESLKSKRGIKDKSYTRKFIWSDDGETLIPLSRREAQDMLPNLKRVAAMDLETFGEWLAKQPEARGIAHLKPHEIAQLASRDKLASLVDEDLLFVKFLRDYQKRTTFVEQSGLKGSKNLKSASQIAKIRYKDSAKLQGADSTTRGGGGGRAAMKTANRIASKSDDRLAQMAASGRRDSFAITSVINTGRVIDINNIPSLLAQWPGIKTATVSYMAHSIRMGMVEVHSRGGIAPTWPPNDPDTVHRKGFDKPLFETGTLLNSIRIRRGWGGGGEEASYAPSVGDFAGVPTFRTIGWFDEVTGNEKEAAALSAIQASDKASKQIGGTSPINLVKLATVHEFGATISTRNRSGSIRIPSRAWLTQTSDIYGQEIVANAHLYMWSEIRQFANIPIPAAGLGGAAYAAMGMGGKQFGARRSGLGNVSLGDSYYKSTGGTAGRSSLLMSNQPNSGMTVDSLRMDLAGLHDGSTSIVGVGGGRAMTSARNTDTEFTNILGTGLISNFRTAGGRFPGRQVNFE